MLVKATLEHRSSTSSVPKNLLIHGSTGSIGESTLEIVRRHQDKFRVFGLTAGSNIERLAQQVQEFKPKFVSLSDTSKMAILKSRVLELGTNTEVVDSGNSLSELSCHPELDIVMAAIVGFAGFESVLSALGAGKTVALANKESVVVGGRFLDASIRAGKGILIPVDSEHSALFQIIRQEKLRDVRRLILTASGGPFLRTPIAKLCNVTPNDAVRHPRWSMGQKISVDSATMVNKALEVIEANWLFGIDVNQIDVIVHPQSLVHSVVEFKDGTQVLQAATPDMKAPIGFALNYPNGRLDDLAPAFELSKVESLSFEPLDEKRFPIVTFAKKCVTMGEGACLVLNTANEVAVAQFLAGEIRFDRIVPFIMESVEKHSVSFSTLSDLLNLERNLRAILYEEVSRST